VYVAAGEKRREETRREEAGTKKMDSHHARTIYIHMA
jgi:hypothetical protein